jgi:hypothetical protein
MSLFKMHSVELCCGQQDFFVAKAHATASRLQKMLVADGPVIVERMSADEEGGVVLTLSRDLCLVIVPDGIEGSEDWRFFAYSSAARHFVIKGGQIDPWSLSSCSEPKANN